MKRLLHRRPDVHFSLRHAVAALSACLFLTLGLAALGCGGPPDHTSSTAAIAGTTSPPASADDTATTAALGGRQLGQAVGATWVEAMQKLNDMLASKPEASEVKDRVETLKEQYIQLLVTYGAQAQSLDGNGRADATASVAATLAAAAGTDWYSAYMSNYNEYAKASSDRDFLNSLASFNTLTQYADYDLLKSQDPKEATRLGID